MRVFETALSKLSTIIAMIGGAVIVLMMVQTSLDVFTKYVLNWPIPGSLEITASYYMVAIVFLPLGAVTRDREHLEVELFTQHLPPRRLAFYQSFGALIGAIYTAVILWQATKIALKMTRLGEVWETATFDIPVWSSRWFFVLGASLMLIYLILQAVDHFVYATRGEHFLPDRRPPKATEGMDTVEVDAIAVGKGGASAD